MQSGCNRQAARALGGEWTFGEGVAQPWEPTKMMGRWRTQPCAVLREEGMSLHPQGAHYKERQIGMECAVTGVRGHGLERWRPDHSRPWMLSK